MGKEVLSPSSRRSGPTRVFTILGGSTAERRKVEEVLRAEHFETGDPLAASLGVALLDSHDSEQEDVSSSIAAWRDRLRGGPLIAIGPPSLTVAISALRAGACDYVIQPFDTAQLVASARLHAVARAAVRNVRKADMLVGDSHQMRALFAQLERAASSTLPVLVTGESGSGKELAARALHYTGSRRSGPFIAINAGAISESLAEAELFGAKRGAYTGADRDRAGVFVEASGGTLFLDEIGTASHTLQIKLLRALERGEVTPVGSARAIPIDVRIVAATNVPIDRLVADGALRNDLYYRLAGVLVAMPPLRERKEDLALIVTHHLILLAARTGQPVPRVPREALTKLERYDWPGNVRELVSVLTNALLTIKGGVLRPEDLALPQQMMASPPLLPFREARQQFEADYVRRALTTTAGSVAEAARLAGRERKDFYELCRRSGVDPTGFRMRERAELPGDEPESD